MSSHEFPDEVTIEQVGTALRALGITQVPAELRELTIDPEGVKVVVIRARSAIAGNDASTVTARIGIKHPMRARGK